MDHLTISAASGMRARLESLEMLANNLANAATAGYKLDREFYSLYISPDVVDGSAEPSVLPVIERHWTDFNQGTLTPTGSPLDFGLAGKGFFVVDGPNGPLYTRNGNFRLTAAGVLTTVEGYPVRSSAGTRIQTVSSAPLEVSADGTVRQGGQALGSLAIAALDQHGAVEKLGKNYFRTDGSPGLATGVEVHQGKLEASNVSAPESAVRLISLMRQFEMLQKATALGADMSRKAIEEVARATQ